MGTTAPHGNHRSSWERVAPLHRGPPWLPRWPPEVSPAPRPAPPRPYPRPAPPPPAPPGEQVFGIALVSDFFLLVTGVAGSCFYCKRRRRSRCALAPWGPCAPCRAVCAPACGIGCDRPLGARGACQAPDSRRRVCHRHVLAPYHPSSPLSHTPALRPSGREARSRLPTREPREPYTSRTTTRSSARREGGAKARGARARYS